MTAVFTPEQQAELLRRAREKLLANRKARAAGRCPDKPARPEIAGRLFTPPLRERLARSGRAALRAGVVLVYGYAKSNSADC